MRLFRGSLVAPFLGLVLFATPSPATPLADSGAVAFTGTASTCTDAPPSTTCSSGLLLFDFGEARDGDWDLNASCGWAGQAYAGVCSLNISADIGPMLGLGAWCSWAHVHDGTGSLTNGSVSYQILDWQIISTTGGTGVLSGSYALSSDPGSKPAGTRSGPIEGLVQMQGGAACAAGGATSLTVAGAFALI